MEYKRIITPFLLAGLFAAFAMVCLMVWLRKGRQGKWVSRKMKLGAAILTLTGVVSCNPPLPVITCYDPMPQNSFNFDNIDYNDYSVVADLPTDSVLTGTVFEPTYSNFIFKVMKSDSLLVDQGNVDPVDGDFNQSPDSFRLVLNSALDTGKYRLTIYPYERDNKVSEIEVFQINLKIK